MTEFNNGLADVYGQLALSDSELALSALARDVAAAQKQVDDAAWHFKFEQGYKPTPPGPRPHPEAGGMDHQDWDVARLEYEQDDREYEIDKAEHELDDAGWRLDNLLDSKELAEQGDQTVISTVAGRERSRLLEEIRRAARNKERREGVKLPGALELYESLAALQADTDRLWAARGKTGSNGWQRAEYRPTWCQGSVFRVNPEGGPLKSFSSYTQLLEVAAGETGATLHYSEMPTNASVRRLDADWRAVTVDYYTLHVSNEGVVTNQAHRRGDASQQHYIGTQYSSINQPIHNYAGVQELDFTPEDIAKFRTIAEQINADVNEVTAGQ